MQIGDIVQVENGEVKMTVYSMVNQLPEKEAGQLIENGFQEDDVLCKWFVGTTLKKQVFHQQQLQKVS
ncbi:MAG: DUF2158 domain-containing protein [Gammaproteobacteria bacterium]|nr:DUF2158 domain-containing protein [Gammaproteobacteria bacterium]NVK87882.1 DUF2158 domain-containing protein [Gammaproteobacteria bacterium]